VSEILQAAPEVKVLATSREKLNLQEETRFRLEGMGIPASMPSSTETLEDAGPIDWTEYSAVKLFTQSARQARPGFELGVDDLQCVTRICQLVGGMPLAILLAAAWVEIFSPKEIAGEISRSLDFLETELRDVPDRHRSIQAVFDSSWDQLSAVERETFMKLSVFRGGFRRPAAQAVAGANLRMLVALVNKSLLRRDPSSGRYEIHELLRHYGGEKLKTAGQAGPTRDAHCAYYAEFTHQRRTELRGRRQIAALGEIEADFENVRQAWQWAVRQKDYAAIDRSSEILYAFCDMRSRGHEGEALFRAAREGLAPQPSQEPHPAWGRVLLPWYDMRMYLGRLEQYEEITVQAQSNLAAAQKRGDRPGIAHSLALLGVLAEDTDAFTEAISFYEQSLDHYRELDNYFWIAIRVGLSYQAAGQHEQAIKFFQQSLDRGREFGDIVRIAWSLTNLGDTVVLAGDNALAENYWREADRLFRQIGTPVGIIRTNIPLSSIAFTRRDLEQAKALAEDTMEIARDIGSTSGYREASIYLGWVAVVEEGYTQGKQRFEAALSVSPTSLEANLGLSFAACGLDEYQTAEKHLLAALKSPTTSRAPAMATLILPAAAITLAVHESETERAVEWLALAFHHPTSPTSLLKKWPLLTRLCAHLEAKLGSQVYTAAWERGQALDFQAVIATLADHFQAI
jgi:predicted ATPase